jgi:DNA-binding SARP family transcriptional activator
MSAGIASAVGPDTTTVLEEAFEGLSVAVVLLDDAGVVLHGNALAHSLFGEVLSRSDARCCDLVSCSRGDGTRPLAYHCVAAAALERGDRLTGLGFSFAGRPMEVSATPLSGGSGVVLELTSGVREQPAAAPIAEPLEITTLGAFSLRCGGRALGGAWLHHRPGQVLRYLLCSRGHSVPADEIVEAIWPDADRAGLISLRQAVHVLRDRLEPDRPRHVPSRFIIASGGGYELSMDASVDADSFEADAHAALCAVDRSADRNAVAALARAARLYSGDFLADAPYDDWALGERDRLRNLATRILRELADLEMAAGELPHASSALRRLVDFEPLDLGAQRELLTLMLRQGQHPEAVRRYKTMRLRFKRAFGHEPGFVLADLAPLGSR